MSQRWVLTTQMEGEFESESLFWVNYSDQPSLLERSPKKNGGGKVEGDPPKIPLK